VGTTHGACEDCFGTSGEIATLCKKKKKKKPNAVLGNKKSNTWGM
jgi:hypothetical protein